MNARRLRWLIVFAPLAAGCRDARPPRPLAIVRDDAHAFVEVEPGRAPERTYRLTTTAPRPDDLPKSPRIVRERAGDPRLRTGNDMFDALYALALEEAHEASVRRIADGAFDDGRPLACPPPGCFETGRKWTYVWTRDTAYAVDLGLAELDPFRAMRSLELKTSRRRGGVGPLEIVQDTGSGGSWPVSTDRVVWALGAARLLDELEGPERDAFRDRALEAIGTTLEHDRHVVWDPADGLYRGEQSFLDWRAQTYPAWTATDTIDVGLSKALSTNVLHFNALEIGARLARERGDARADRWSGWAAALRTSIRERLWLEDAGLFSTFLPSFLDAAPVRRFDLLGSALAVLSGVADERQADAILRSYPDVGHGPPVVWPVEPGVRTYHNRAFWPFATAYWLLAARRARNDAVADRALASLVNGSALHLSNFENYELFTGRAWLDDGEVSGPVINSQRQLWSIAGYVAMVHDALFGREVSAEGIRFRPYVTRGMHRTWFAGATRLAIERLPWRGRRLAVTVRLPALAAGGGAYAVSSVRVDGREVGDRFVPASAIGRESRVEIALAAPTDPHKTSREVAGDVVADAPRTPRIASVEPSPEGGLRLAIDGAGERGIVFDVFRDGRAVARGVPGDAVSWRDPDPGASPCYAIASTFVASGNASHHARPVCFRGVDGERVFPAGALVVTGRLDAWSGPDATIELRDLTATATGDHAIELVATNPGDVTTGVTCGVVHAVVESGSQRIAEGWVFVPHTAPGQAGRSSPLRARLERGRQYRVRFDHDADAWNMSDLEHFARYTRGRGGRGGPENTIAVEGVRVYAIAPR